MPSILAALVSLASVGHVNAAGKNWVGGASGAPQDWNTPSNWSPAGVPTSGDDATIPSGRTSYPLLNAAAASTVHTLTINAGGSLVIASGGNLATTAGAGSVAVNGTLSISGGTISAHQDITGSGSVSMSGGTLKIGHDFHLAPGDFSATGGTVEWTGEVGSAGPGGFPGGTGSYQFVNVLIDAGVDPGFDNHANAFSILGNWINNGAASLTGKATAVSFSGGSPQTIGGSSVTTFNNLTVNNAAGVTLATNATVNGTLTMTAGLLNTGPNQISVATAGSVSGAGAGSYVNGNLQKGLATGTNQTFAFPVGDASNYSPITITLSNITTAGSVTASATIGDHPAIAASGVSASRDVNRYWTLKNSGLVFTRYNALCSFVPSDVDFAANPANFIVARKDTSGWSWPSVTARTATNTTASGMTNFGDFVAGEPVPIAPTISSQPQSQAVMAGVTAQFSVQATGTGSLAYQWLFNGNVITGATNSFLTITNAQNASGGTYSVIVDNGSTTTSSGAVLAVNQAPVQPPGDLRISMNANGSIALHFQGVPGAQYLVQATDTLAPPAWVTLTTTIADTSGLVAIMDADAANHPVRFYRAAFAAP